MASQTSNYGFNLPEVDGSEDLWGELLNQNWTQLDALLEIGLDGRLTTVEGLAGGAVQAQELADPTQGGELVHVTTLTGEQTLAEALNTRAIYVATIADLQALPTSELVDGQVAVVGADGDNNGVYTYVATAWGRISTDPDAIADLEGRAGVLEDRVGDLEGGAGVLEGRVDDLENNIDATLQPYVDSASVQADRAETARDAAFVNADVYDDIAAGLAATSDGEQFQVVEGDEVVRYRNESGSAAEVARYPASEFVNIALDVASQPGLVSGEFYADDGEQPVYSITDEAGNALATWDQRGEMDVEPSQALSDKVQRARAEFHTEDGQPAFALTDEDGNALATWDQRGEMDVEPSQALSDKVQRARGEFHTSDDGEQPAFALTDEDGRPLYAVDENGQPVVPLISEFHITPGEVRYAWTDTALRIFYAIDETGNSVIGGGGGISGDSIPVRLAGTGPKEVYAQYNKLALTPSGDSFYGRAASSARAIVPNAQDMFDLLDELVDEFPDYIERTLLGQDGIGNDIYQYRANPASYWTRWYDANAPEVLTKPKIILFGATHGNEKEAALTNYKLLREICLRWREDERLSFLRWGADILLIPVLNPSGFNKSEEGRYNHNDVDINRNYPYGWTQTSRSGPYPASELETQIALQVFADHPDACAIIDHHNAGSLNNADTPYAYWIGTERPETIELARMSCDHMMAYLRKEYPYVPQDNSRITRLVDSFNGTMAKHVQRELGFNAFTLEGGSGFAEPLDRERHELEALTNLIAMCVKQENLRRVRETTFTY